MENWPLGASWSMRETKKFHQTGTETLIWPRFMLGWRLAEAGWQTARKLSVCDHSWATWVTYSALWNSQMGEPSRLLDILWKFHSQFLSVTTEIAMITKGMFPIVFSSSSFPSFCILSTLSSRFLWKAPPPTLWLRSASAFLHSWERHTALHRLCALGLPLLSYMCTGSRLIFSQGMKFASLVNIKNAEATYVIVKSKVPLKIKCWHFEDANRKWNTSQRW